MDLRSIEYLSFQLDKEEPSFKVNERLEDLEYNEFHTNQAVDLSRLPYGKFADSTFTDLSIGSVNLLRCKAKTVRATGNILIRDSDIEEVITDGKVCVFNCTNLKHITAKVIYTNQMLSGRIDGILERLVYPPDEATSKEIQEKGYTARIPSGASLDNFFPDKFTHTVLIDNGICKGDVIFPKDSIIPEEKRVVILKNGGQLHGDVFRGRLENQN